MSPAATRAIWRYLLDMDWVSQLHAWFLPMDHPLFLMLADPRRLRLTVRDTLWIRLIDVAAALTARSYGDAGTIVLELTDAFCPWNAGRWRIGAKSTERTQQAPTCAPTSPRWPRRTWAVSHGISSPPPAGSRSCVPARWRRPTRSSAPTPRRGARSYSDGRR